MFFVYYGRRLSLTLVSKNGKVIKTTEDKMDVITALSGSGPAFYFKIIELMAQSATKLGLDKNEALLLSTQTALGSAKMIFENLSKLYGIDLNAPLKNLTKKETDILLYGTNDYMNLNGRNYMFEGIANNIERRYKETNSVWVKFELGRLFSNQTCPVCHGKRLNQKALSVKVDGKDIASLCEMSVEKLLQYFETLVLPEAEREISERIIKEITARLSFLVEVGLTYLSLARTAETLSGGEAQRIRLATQIGSSLMGVLYILDDQPVAFSG